MSAEHELSRINVAVMFEALQCIGFAVCCLVQQRQALVQVDYLAQPRGQNISRCASAPYQGSILEAVACRDGYLNGVAGFHTSRRPAGGRQVDSHMQVCEPV